MIYKVDLHTHSTASDGQYSPRQLAQLVKNRGAEVWALTDHDTIDGVEEAIEEGKKLGLRVLRGVELSAKEYPNFHILGYGFPSGASGLWEMCEEYKRGRDRRKYRIQTFLRNKGVEIPLAEVEEAATGGVIGRPHFAQVMVRHGYVASRREAFDCYLDTEEYQAFDKGARPSAKECVERLKQAGGKVSLAHPYQIALRGSSLEELVETLAGYGLDAIECYYPKHTLEQRVEYLRLADKFGLHVTGGSDFHGEGNKPDHPLSAWELELDWLV